MQLEPLTERVDRTERTEKTERAESADRAVRLDRAGLERLDRDSLIARAEKAGVARARILTRPELVDELVQRDMRAHGRGAESTQRARGFFGMARDLLARIVERGLNLPDAAERIRAAGTPPPPARTMASALPTVTLAELYATQGHKARAVETLRRVLEQEPEHSTARALLTQLEDTTYKSPEPVLPPEPEVDAGNVSNPTSAASAGEALDAADAAGATGAAGSEDAAGAASANSAESGATGAARIVRAPGVERVEARAETDATSVSIDAPATMGESADIAEASTVSDVATEAADVADVAAEPFGMLDDAVLPTRYDVDECIALPVDPTTLFVYWEVRQRTREHLAAERGQGGVALRVLVIVPGWEGPRTETLDFPVGATLGDWFVHDLPAGCVVRAAIGWKEHDVFLPIAHSPALETPPGAPSPVMADTLVHWTPDGVYKVTNEDSVGTSVVHAIEVFRDRAFDELGATDGSRDGAGAAAGDAAGTEGEAGAAGAGAAWNPLFDGDIRFTPIGSSERMARGGFPLGGPPLGVKGRGISATPSRPMGSSDRMLGSSERLLARG